MSLVMDYPNAVAVGQAIVAGGTAQRETFEHVDQSKLLELPVFEECQLGMSIGLSLQGVHPVLSVFPRWNFLLLAANQLVNHMDRLHEFGRGYAPQVIVRVAVGSDEPLNPGPQHLGNFSAAFRLMLRNTPVVELEDAEQVVPAYRRALASRGSSVLVEFASKYGD
jgi:pyruvate/2-oxoglutarate/acetoin dehydrogenase E1 component